MRLNLRSLAGMGMTVAGLSLLACTAMTPAAMAQDATTLTIETAETAGIDGRSWDTTFPAATTADAVHRAVLLRFPGAAEQIKAKLENGLVIKKAELALTYAAYETSPRGYTLRTGMGLPKWTADPPRWHLVPTVLRRPWASDAELGPTFNAYINKAAYWSRYGAGDEQKDRMPESLAPMELSSQNPEGRVDITPLVTETKYGVTTGQRLRALDERGFLLKKLESYDARYRLGDAYEWATPTGGHGLSFKAPRLIFTFKPGPKTTVPLPPAVAIPALAAQITAAKSGGSPTAVMPSDADMKKLAQLAALKKPEGMPDWQFQRVVELSRIGGDRISGMVRAIETGDRKQYEKMVSDLLSIPPRYWQGWGIQDDLLLWYLYHDLLPAYVQDHMKAYWTSWLMPDIPTRDFLFPMGPENEAYRAKTNDWRGRASFFRAGFNSTASTQNFNHTATMGSLLGGAIIGSDAAMGDGRAGLEQLPLRFWSFLDGSTQEMLDHYYFSVTLSGQKMFTDFGPTHFDRLMGRVITDRAVDLLASAYHPNLRRYISSSGRANLSGVLVEQEGVYALLHTLSKKGVLKYLDQPYKATSHNMNIWGSDLPPGRVALQSLREPWAPEWMANVVDEKPLPFQETATETTRNNFNPPLWRRLYLGHHYGLASQDLKGGTVDVMAQWNSRAEASTQMEDLGTLTLRYAVNEPDMATTSGGIMPYMGGVATFQDKNRAIICTKPRTEKTRLMELAGKNGLSSLSSVIALWNFRDTPGWELFVDDRLVTEFPFKMKANQLITIHDGVSYISIRPLPATDLGRTDEVTIGYGGGGKPEHGNGPIKPALLITSYNFQKTAPVPFDQLDWDRINNASYGGFIVEMGDAQEYPDFAVFQKHMRETSLETKWDEAAKILGVTYRTGKDVMEMGFCTNYAQSEVHFAVMPGQHTKAIPYRRLNGEFPYLPAGIERDSTLSQQGTTGRLEKNGAVLVTEPGRKAFLQTEPRSGTYTAFNPFPDPTPWSLTVPGGVEVRAEGKLGIARVGVQPGPGKLTVDTAVKPGQEGMAKSLLVFGLKAAPQVQLNGLPYRGKLARKALEGRQAWVVPLN